MLPFQDGYSGPHVMSGGSGGNGGNPRVPEWVPGNGPILGGGNNSNSGGGSGGNSGDGNPGFAPGQGDWVPGDGPAMPDTPNVPTPDVPDVPDGTGWFPGSGSYLTGSGDTDSPANYDPGRDGQENGGSSGGPWLPSDMIPGDGPWIPSMNGAFQVLPTSWTNGGGGGGGSGGNNPFSGIAQFIRTTVFGSMAIWGVFGLVALALIIWVIKP